MPDLEASARAIFAQAAANVAAGVSSVPQRHDSYEVDGDTILTRRGLSKSARRHERRPLPIGPDELGYWSETCWAASE